MQRSRGGGGKGRGVLMQGSHIGTCCIEQGSGYHGDKGLTLVKPPCDRAKLLPRAELLDITGKSRGLKYEDRQFSVGEKTWIFLVFVEQKLNVTITHLNKTLKHDAHYSQWG